MPAPPWHYVGDFLVIEYWADPAAVAAVLPAGPRAAPRPGPVRGALRRLAVVLGLRARSCSSRARGQYKEFFIVVNALLDGEPVTTCPYIWVDKDFALVRGWIQGFPKKLGQIEMTRSFGLDCRAEGRTFAGTVAANGHRLAQGTVTPERESRGRADPQRPAARSTAATSPGWPPGGTPTRPCTSWCARSSRDRSISAIHEGPATLELLAAPGEEHAALAPVRVGNGFRFTFAYTVDDLETVREL